MSPAYLSGNFDIPTYMKHLTKKIEAKVSAQYFSCKLDRMYDLSPSVVASPHSVPTIPKCMLQDVPII